LVKDRPLISGSSADDFRDKTAALAKMVIPTILGRYDQPGTGPNLHSDTESHGAQDYWIKPQTARDTEVLVLPKSDCRGCDDVGISGKIVLHQPVGHIPMYSDLIRRQHIGQHPIASPVVHRHLAVVAFGAGHFK